MTRDQMAQRDVFLSEIRDDPDDDVPRLILGDWLADQGDPRGEFIQIDVRLATTPDGPGRQALEERRRQLLAAHATEWLGPLLDVVSGWRWERGLLHVEARPERLFGGDSLSTVGGPAFEWVEGIRLHGIEGMPYPWWRSLLPRVTTLDLTDELLDSVRLARFLRFKAHLQGLRSLLVANASIGLSGVARLANCPHLARLTRLDLSGNAITTEAAHALANSPHLTRLRRVDLGGANLSYSMIARLNERFGAGVVRLSRPPGP